MQYALFYIDFFVNNIQKNHHLTALNDDFIIVCVTFLIMSFIGLSPFIQIYIQKMKSQRLCVNALYRASSISTGNRNSGDYNSGNVSMPFIGLSPFLHVYLVQNVITKENVSMPFIGLSPFLHMSNTILKNMLCQCQCPLSGFLHFYI